MAQFALRSPVAAFGRLAHSAAAMRILLTNDDGVNARGMTLLEAVARRLADDIWIVAPSEEQSGAGHSLTLTQPVRLRQSRRPALLGHRHADRRGDARARPCDEGFAARRDPVGDQPRRQPRRGRHLFGHRVGGDGRRARRSPLDRAQPGLFARGHGRHRPVRRGRRLGRARAGAAAGVRDRARHADQRQLPGRAARRGQGHPRLPPGHPRLRPAADRPADRSARL